MSTIPGKLSLNHPILVSSAIQSGYYPSLIIIVLMSHLNNLYQGQISDLIFNGALGVNIFFVISGFLITTLCIKERNFSGTIALKNFYVRRILRIFPVAYLYILVIFVMNLCFHLRIAWFQFIGALVYIMNLNYFRFNQFSWFTGHFWSLANEEQFYLIFPFILKKNVSVFKIVNLFIVIIIPLICLTQAYVQALNQGIMYGFTHYLIKFQAISIGCLLSIFAFEKRLDGQLLRNIKVPGNIIALFLIFYLNYDPFFSIHAVFVNLSISLITAYLIISNIVPAKDFIFRLLNLRFMSFVGILSYSIYVWQEIFTSKNNKLHWFMVSYPCNIVFIIVVPLISYFFYEKYFLKRKSRFA